MVILDIKMEDSAAEIEQMSPTSQIELVSDEELKIIVRAFQLFDRNSDLKIDQAEFAFVIRAIGYNPTESQIRETLQEYDKNKDGVIDFHEFVAMSRNFTGCSKDKLEENLRQAFRIFDRDGNGFVSAEELRYVVTKVGDVLTEAEADELIRMFDVDGDNQLNYEEFVVYARKSLSEYLQSL